MPRRVSARNSPREKSRRPRSTRSSRSTRSTWSPSHLVLSDNIKALLSSNKADRKLGRLGFLKLYKDYLSETGLFGVLGNGPRNKQEFINQINVLLESYLRSIDMKITDLHGEVSPSKATSNIKLTNLESFRSEMIEFIQELNQFHQTRTGMLEGRIIDSELIAIISAIDTGMIPFESYKTILQIIPEKVAIKEKKKSKLHSFFSTLTTIPKSVSSPQRYKSVDVSFLSVIPKRIPSPQK